jgi:hypothetical protein
LIKIILKKNTKNKIKKEKTILEKKICKAQRGKNKKKCGKKKKKKRHTKKKKNVVWKNL